MSTQGSQRLAHVLLSPPDFLGVSLGPHPVPEFMVKCTLKDKHIYNSLFPLSFFAFLPISFFLAPLLLGQTHTQTYNVIAYRFYNIKKQLPASRTWEQDPLLTIAGNLPLAGKVKCDFYEL